MENHVFVVGGIIKNEEFIMKVYPELSKDLKLHFVTKYYSAFVSFHFVGIKDLEKKKELQKVKPQGMILVFSSEEEFIDLQKFFKDYKFKDSLQNTIMVKYLGNSKCIKSNNKDFKENKFIEESRLWCIENSMELVEYEKEPERINQALQCTMWPSMSREKPVKETFPKNEKKEEKEKVKEIESDVESRINNFDELLSGMLELRKNVNNLNDDDRKDMAGKYAMKLLSFLEEEDDGHEIEKKDKKK